MEPDQYESMSMKRHRSVVIINKIVLRSNWKPLNMYIIYFKFVSEINSHAKTMYYTSV